MTQNSPHAAAQSTAIPGVSRWTDYNSAYRQYLHPLAGPYTVTGGKIYDDKLSDLPAFSGPRNAKPATSPKLDSSTGSLLPNAVTRLGSGATAQVPTESATKDLAEQCTNETGDEAHGEESEPNDTTNLSSSIHFWELHD